MGGVLTLLTDRAALERLEELISADEAGRSAYWQAEMDTFSINADGTFTGTALVGNMGKPPDPLRNAAHWALQTPFRKMARDLPDFAACQREARTIARDQNRQYGHDVLRQALTLAQIRKCFPDPDPGRALVVIGDGFGVMTVLLRKFYPGNPVILANLTKPLLVDLTFARKASPADSLSLATDAETMTQALSGPPGIVGVRADDSAAIAAADVALAINILSMQEMFYPAIESYFAALRGSRGERTAFYCANRLAKTLHDGTLIEMDKYPWDAADEIVFDEICEWSQLNYQKSPPFWIKRGRGRNKIVHQRFVWLSKAGTPAS